MATPTALLVSCSPSVDALGILKKITENGVETAFSPIAEDVEGYPWQISNKYYTADILICVAKPCVMGSLTLGESMEAVVIAMDDKAESFKTAKSQWATVKEINPEIRILACKQFTKSPGVSKQVILEWCLENSFELVELESPENEDEEEEDGFVLLSSLGGSHYSTMHSNKLLPVVHLTWVECSIMWMNFLRKEIIAMGGRNRILKKAGAVPYGVERIVSALHAHTWSNLEMKEDNGAHLRRLQERYGDDSDDNRTEPENFMSSNDASLHGYIPINSSDELDSEDHNIQPERSQTSQENSETLITGAVESALTDNDNTRTMGVSEQTNSESDFGSLGDVAASSGATGVTSGGADASPVNSKSGKAKKVTAGPDKIDAMLNEDRKIFEALGNEDPGSESFEQLFSRMSYMKEKASTLEGEERRQYAEKVAIAFWRAIGGDEAEVDGLDDDDNDH